MRDRFIACLVVLMFLAGCTTANTYYQSKSTFVGPQTVAKLALNLAIDEDKIYQVDTRPNAAERLNMASAANTAAQNSFQTTPLPPGTSTGQAMAGAAVGMVIGLQIVKMSQDAQEQAAANKKALPIQEFLPRDRMAELIKGDILNQVKAQDSITFLKASAEPLNTLLAEPELRFNFDLSRIEVKLNATIKDGNSQEPLYQNSFEYWSKAIGGPNDCLGNCSLWTADNASLLNQDIEEGCKEIVAMLLYDLAATSRPEQKETGAEKTYKFSDKRGTIFMRGKLVKSETDRAWLKDLRGNLRSIPGTQ